MSKFTIDLSELSSNISSERERLDEKRLLKQASVKTGSCKVPVDSNQDKFVKVAYNLYKAEPNFYDDREFWKISEDGQHFIRVFSESNDLPENNSSWTSHNNDDQISLEYKDHAIASIPVSVFKNAANKDMVSIRGTLIRKASKDSSFAIKLMREFSPDRENFIRNAFPELF